MKWLAASAHLRFTCSWRTVRSICMEGCTWYLSWAVIWEIQEMNGPLDSLESSNSYKDWVSNLGLLFWYVSKTCCMCERQDRKCIIKRQLRGRTFFRILEWVRFYSGRLSHQKRTPVNLQSELLCYPTVFLCFIDRVQLHPGLGISIGMDEKIVWNFML